MRLSGDGPPNTRVHIVDARFALIRMSPPAKWAGERTVRGARKQKIRYSGSMKAGDDWRGRCGRRPYIVSKNVRQLQIANNFLVRNGSNSGRNSFARSSLKCSCCLGYP
jgi:hypothetical protein